MEKQIQQLLISVPKNDKKGRQAVTDKAKQLEDELKQKHAKELELTSKEEKVCAQNHSNIQDRTSSTRARRCETTRPFKISTEEGQTLMKINCSDGKIG